MEIYRRVSRKMPMPWSWSSSGHGRHSERCVRPPKPPPIRTPFPIPIPLPHQIQNQVTATSQVSSKSKSKPTANQINQNLHMPLAECEIFKTSTFIRRFHLVCLDLALFFLYRIRKIVSCFQIKITSFSCKNLKSKMYIFLKGLWAAVRTASYVHTLAPRTTNGVHPERKGAETDHPTGSAHPQGEM